MGALPDWMVRRDISITPFSEGVKRKNTISYGLSSYGYDIRIGYKFRVFSPINANEIDPKNFNPSSVIHVDKTPDTATVLNSQEPISTYILIPPHSFALAETVETFRMPRDCTCIVLGKSTYARCGLVLNCTPLEPEWEGVITLELSNTTPLPLRVYCGEGIGQCVFFRSDGLSEQMLLEIYKSNQLTSVRSVTFQQFRDELVKRTKATCEKSYADKGGKYQGQTSITLPTVDKEGEG